MQILLMYEICFSSIWDHLVKPFGRVLSLHPLHPTSACPFLGMPCIFWASKQTPIPPRAFSQPVVIAKPLSMPSPISSNPVALLLWNRGGSITSFITVQALRAPPTVPTDTPICVARCCMELKPLMGCCLESCHCWVFPPKPFYLLQNHCKCCQSRDQIYLFPCDISQ